MPALWGVIGNVSTLEPGFEVSFIVTAANGGPNTGMRYWGRYLLEFYGRDWGASWDRDFTLQYLGYSTDNGAFYYYETEPDKNYEQTIIDVKDYADKMVDVASIF